MHEFKVVPVEPRLTAVLALLFPVYAGNPGHVKQKHVHLPPIFYEMEEVWLSPQRKRLVRKGQLYAQGLPDLVDDKILEDAGKISDEKMSMRQVYLARVKIQ